MKCRDEFMETSRFFFIKQPVKEDLSRVFKIISKRQVKMNGGRRQTTYYINKIKPRTPFINIFQNKVFKKLLKLCWTVDEVMLSEKLMRRRNFSDALLLQRIFLARGWRY